MDYIFPYLIQFVREYTAKVDGLVAKQETKPEAPVAVPPAGPGMVTQFGAPPGPPPGFHVMAPGGQFVPPGVAPQVFHAPPMAFATPPPGFPHLALPPNVSSQGAYQTN